MSTTQNKVIARRFMNEVWNQGRLDVTYELLALNYVGHERNGPDCRGIENAQEIAVRFRSAFPDCHFTIEDEIAEADRVVLHLSLRAIFMNPFFDLPPTGREVQTTGICIYRFVEGKIVESWSNWDELGFRQQLSGD